MKIFLPLIFIIILACNSIKTKTNNNASNGTATIPDYQKLNTFKGTTNDTLAYVRASIINRKSNYIGKEFRTLLKDLELPINNYSPGHSNLIGISPDLSLRFYPDNVSELKRQARIDPVILVVVWEKPLDKEIVFKMLLKNKAVWTGEEEAYFGKQKIKDIVLVEYNFQ